FSISNTDTGCHECSKRRIKCDKTEPRCFKCQKKGIACSGQGVRYRFWEGRACPSKDKRTVKSPRRKSTYQPPLSALPVAIPGWFDDDRGYCPVVDPWCKDCSMPEGDGIAFDAEEEEGEGMQVLNTWSEPSLGRPDHLRDFSRAFSDAVAPIMVVLDKQHNGYRDIILPLACECPIIQRAVSVVAAFHLSAQVPGLQESAQLGQLAIISKLRQDAGQLSPYRPFDISTWATILVLLAGETVTGGNDFVYLLEMLKYITQIGKVELGVSASIHQFLLGQTRMFELFGFPLSEESKGKMVMRKDPDYYFDFITYSLDPQSELDQNIKGMKNAIRIACEIYRRRAESELPHNESIGLLEQLRQHVLTIEPNTDGAHALVWTYFVAAAESVLPSHREFYTDRLRALFARTKFRSIPRALKSLEKIWEMQGLRRWTQIVADESPILVM
ncbi:fungal-specific transcription factor domain-containing protein, partial [Leptodontidium sp. 2 PMI_412]